MEITYEKAFVAF